MLLTSNPTFGCDETILQPQSHFMSTLPKHFSSHHNAHYHAYQQQSQPFMTSRHAGPSYSHSHAHFTTLPRPPLKGILKNSSNPVMLNQFPQEPDVIPFDNLPPCDDCMDRARVEGSYSGDCDKPECSMGNGTIKRRASACNTPSKISNGFGAKNNKLAGSFTQLFPSDAFVSTAFRGSRESLLVKDHVEDEVGLDSSTQEDEEVIENVESSV